jgi:hypothetical protein
MTSPTQKKKNAAFRIFQRKQTRKEQTRKETSPPTNK